jgi:hypothetical protein
LLCYRRSLGLVSPTLNVLEESALTCMLFLSAPLYRAHPRVLWSAPHTIHTILFHVCSPEISEEEQPNVLPFRHKTWQQLMMSICDLLCYLAILLRHCHHQRRELTQLCSLLNESLMSPTQSRIFVEWDIPNSFKILCVCAHGATVSAFCSFRNCSPGCISGPFGSSEHFLEFCCPSCQSRSS